VFVQQLLHRYRLHLTNPTTHATVFFSSRVCVIKTHLFLSFSPVTYITIPGVLRHSTSRETFLCSFFPLTLLNSTHRTWISRVSFFFLRTLLPTTTFHGYYIYPPVIALSTSLPSSSSSSPLPSHGPNHECDFFVPLSPPRPPLDSLFVRSCFFSFLPFSILFFFRHLCPCFFSVCVGSVLK